MMEGSGGIMALEEIAKYKMAGEGKIPARGDNVYKIKRFCLFFQRRYV